VLDRRPQRYGSTEGEAHDRGALEAEAVDELRDVVGHRLEAHRPVGGG